MALYYKIHRYLGVAVAISLVWLSVTGIFLNHTEDLKLDEKHLDNAVLFQLYGLSKPELGKTFQLNKDWILQYGEALHFNDQILKTNIKSLISAVGNDDVYAIGTTEQVLLYTHQGELIDSLKTPETLQKMGWLNKKLLIQTTENMYIANDDITEWQASTQNIKEAQWGQVTPLPIASQKSLAGKYRGQGPTLEQVILDTHSGRLFGMVGVYFTDLMALLTIILTLIGIYLWSRRLRRRKR